MTKKKKKPSEQEAVFQESAEELTAVAVALIKGAAPHVDEEVAYDILLPYMMAGFKDLDEVMAVSEMIASGHTSGTLQ
jgi:hypothetical protein